MDLKQKQEAIQDVNGKTSQKRILGERFMNAGLWFGLGFYILVYGFKIAHLFFPLTVGVLTMSFPTTFFFGLVGIGASLLGITLFEGGSVAGLFSKSKTK